MPVTILSPTSLPDGGSLFTAAQAYALDMVVQCQCAVPAGSPLKSACQVMLLLSSDGGSTFVPAQAATFNLTTSSARSFILSTWADKVFDSARIWYTSAGVPSATGQSRTFVPPWTHWMLLFAGNTGAAVTVGAAGDSGTLSGGGGGGSPGGINTQIQWNNGGAFGGFSVIGDGSLNAVTGVLTVTKTNGTTFAPSATIDTTNAGNLSGGTLPAARLAAFTGDVTTTAGTQVTVIAPGSVTTAKIANSAVTYAKVQNASGSVLLGNPTGSAAAPSEITLGANLSFSGTTLVASGGGTPGGSNAQIQYNNSGAFGGFTVSGDGTLSTAGALVVTKTNGTAFAASATTDTTNAANITSGVLAVPRLPTTGLTITQHKVAVNTVADAATMNFDWSVSDWHLTAALGGNRTLTMSNVTVGQRIFVEVTQASSGGPFYPVWSISGLVWANSPLMPATASATMGVIFDSPSSGVVVGRWVGNSDGSGPGTIVQDTDGSTITFDLSKSNWHQVQLGGNRTLALANAGTNQEFYIYLQQAASGGPYNPTWFSTITWLGESTLPPAMPITANAYMLTWFKQTSAGNYVGRWMWNSDASIPANTYNVRDYGATGNGTTDDTTAIQNALTAAGAANTGNAAIVLVPPGQYLIAGQLSIPNGVQMVGTWQAHPDLEFARGAGWLGYPGSMLLITGNAGSSTATAAITLGSSSGIKGFAIYYPNQSRTAATPTAYPYAISASPSSAGVGTVIADILLINPYQGIYAGLGRTHVRNVAGQPLSIGLKVESSQDICRFEDIHFWPFWESSFTGSTPSVWQLANGTAFAFGRSDEQYCRGLFAYGYNVGYSFYNQASGTTGPTYGQFTDCSVDNCNTGISAATIGFQGITWQGGGIAAVNNNVTMSSSTGMLTMTGVRFWSSGTPNFAISAGVFGLHGSWIQSQMAIAVSGGTASITGNTFDNASSSVAFSGAATGRTSGNLLAGGSFASIVSNSSSGAVTIDEAHNTVAVVADGSTVTFNLSLADWFLVQIAGNRTLAFGEAVVGTQFSVQVQQDATGSRTVTWPPGCFFSAATPPTLTTTPWASDIVTFKVAATGAYFVADLRQNIGPASFADTFTGTSGTVLSSHTADSGATWPTGAAHQAGAGAMELDGSGGLFLAGTDSANIPSSSMPGGNYEVFFSYKRYSALTTQFVQLTLNTTLYSGSGSQVGLILAEPSWTTTGIFFSADNAHALGSVASLPAVGTTIHLRVRSITSGGNTTFSAATTTDGVNYTDLGITATVTTPGAPVDIGPYLAQNGGASWTASTGPHFLGPFVYRALD